jgi:hypothetical protein
MRSPALQGVRTGSLTPLISKLSAGSSGFWPRLATTRTGASSKISSPAFLASQADKSSTEDANNPYEANLRKTTGRL